MPTREFRTSKDCEAQLVEFFRSPEGNALGHEGDYDNLSTAETAIRAIRRLIDIEAKSIRWCRLCTSRLLGNGPGAKCGTCHGDVIRVSEETAILFARLAVESALQQVELAALRKENKQFRAFLEIEE